MGEPQYDQEQAIPMADQHAVFVPAERIVLYKKEDCFLVRMKQSQRNANGEKEVWIHKQEAVCRICFQMLAEADSVLKTKCNCPFTLIHTMCAAQWAVLMCDNCKKSMQTIPVTLSDPTHITPATTSNPPRQKKRHEPTLQRNQETGGCSIL